MFLSGDGGEKTGYKLLLAPPPRFTTRTPASLKETTKRQGRDSTNQEAMAYAYLFKYIIIGDTGKELFLHVSIRLAVHFRSVG